MNILMVGGAGRVGQILRPAIEARHTVRYLDLRPVEGAEERSLVGDICDPAVLAQACEGQDAVVQLAMYPGGDRGPETVIGSYNVHVLGMELLLRAAYQAGARRAVYASTLSVYQGDWRRVDGEVIDETVPPDSPHLYGLTKRLGEEVAKAFCVRHPDMSVIAIQMVQPKTSEEYQKPLREGQHPAARTGPEDLRDLYLRALELDGHTGYDAVMSASDPNHNLLNLTKARTLLGWVPQCR